MSSIATQPTSEPSQGLITAIGADFVALGRWAVLGAACGGIAGLLVGGVGGRLAMLLLRLTSSGYVNGIQTDDGFEIGRVTLGGTLSLFAATMFFGALVGLFVVLARAFLPGRWVVGAWGVAGAAVGGTLLIHDGGVDFTLLTPHWLAVLLFVAIPGVGTLLMASLVRMFEPWWWRRRSWTAATAVAAWPLIVLSIVVVPVLLAASVLLQHPAGRALPGIRATRVLALGTFALVTSVAGIGLAADLFAVL